MTPETGGILIGILVAVGVGNRFFGSRARLRVTPRRLEARGSRIPQGIGIEVVNLGGSTVRIDEVGYLLPGAVHSRIAPAVTLQNEPLPLDLAPGARITVRGHIEEADLRVLARARCAYARTDDGRLASGTSPEFREFVGFAGALFQGTEDAPEAVAG
ncbi:MAG TPA: hypothetical protein VND21_09745 [Planctomycetota bacterium]|nr:hypothetical protein [Planctomycetota bacterium]